MKKTAVEWLAEKLEYVNWMRNRDEIFPELADKWRKHYLEQALEMEKEEIIKAYNEGQNTPYEYSESNDVNWYDGNNYYKETFNS